MVLTQGTITTGGVVTGILHRTDPITFSSSSSKTLPAKCPQSPTGRDVETIQAHSLLLLRGPSDLKASKDVQVSMLCRLVICYNDVLLSPDQEKSFRVKKLATLL
jgi:hypothetical protein